MKISRIFAVATMLAFLPACGGGGGTADTTTGNDVIEDTSVDTGHDPGSTDLYVPSECQTADDCKDKFPNVGQCETVICNALQQCEKVGVANNTHCDDGVECRTTCVPTVYVPGYRLRTVPVRATTTARTRKTGTCATAPCTVICLTGSAR